MAITACILNSLPSARILASLPLNYEELKHIVNEHREKKNKDVNKKATAPLENRMQSLHFEWCASIQIHIYTLVQSAEFSHFKPMKPIRFQMVWKIIRILMFRCWRQQTSILLGLNVTKHVSNVYNEHLCVHWFNCVIFVLCLSH